MTLVLDAGALIAIERNDRAIWRRLKSALNSSETPVTHGGVVGQVWRGGGSRSALIALALDGMEVEALDEDLGRLSGELLTWAKKNDVIDAALVLIAKDGDTILTSDPGDIQPLARAASRMVSLIAV